MWKYAKWTNGSLWLKIITKLNRSELCQPFVDFVSIVKRGRICLKLLFFLKAKWQIIQVQIGKWTQMHCRARKVINLAVQTGDVK